MHCGVLFREYKVIDGVIHVELCFVLVGLELVNHICVSIELRFNHALVFGVINVLQGSIEDDRSF